MEAVGAVQSVIEARASVSEGTIVRKETMVENKHVGGNTKPYLWKLERMLYVACPTKTKRSVNNKYW